MGQLGLPEMIIIGIIALLIFGPKKLPELGTGLGKAIRDFKGAMNEPDRRLKTRKPRKTKKKRRKRKSQEAHNACASCDLFLSGRRRCGLQGNDGEGSLDPTGPVNSSFVPSS